MLPIFFLAMFIYISFICRVFLRPDLLQFTLFPHSFVSPFPSRHLPPLCLSSLISLLPSFISSIFRLSSSIPLLISHFLLLCFPPYPDSKATLRSLTPSFLINPHIDSLHIPSAVRNYRPHFQHSFPISLAGFTHCSDCRLNLTDRYSHFK